MSVPYSYRRTNKKKKLMSPITTKIVRVDDKTQIEVPINVPDHIAIERFLQRKKLGPRPPKTYSKVIDGEEEMPPEELEELIEETSEEDDNEEGDD
jgi:hypothetical protein